MSTKLFVGSLKWEVTDDQLKELFSQVGTVVSAQVVSDKFSGRSKGFGFVEMSSEEEAKAAIEKFNGYDFQGRAMVVNEARPKEDRPQRDRGNYSNNYR
ncbi:MAG TPA: RNA-binding protein [bacterium]|nr:RNA-binding protein [bacterium]HPL95635.1 RNA-binding protein [bacterium]